MELISIRVKSKKRFPKGTKFTLSGSTYECNERGELEVPKEVADRYVDSGWILCDEVEKEETQTVDDKKETKSNVKMISDDKVFVGEVLKTFADSDLVDLAKSLKIKVAAPFKKEGKEEQLRKMIVNKINDAKLKLIFKMVLATLAESEKDEEIDEEEIIDEKVVTTNTPPAE